MSHDYSKIASELLQSLGGVDNIEQAAHCVTRLRLSLKDAARVDSATLNQIDLVKGSFLPVACSRWSLARARWKRSMPPCAS